MAFLERDGDTICALSTPPGHGGISVIRVSGIRSLNFVRKLCGFLPKKVESHRVYYGEMRTRPPQQDILDEVLITYFENGRSFTGEEIIEISCHGSEYIVASILNELIGVGCRLADRGEFTYRAFMNGRLDLVQAESVLSLIKSQSKDSAKIAMSQLKGELSLRYAEIENALLLILSHMEAGIDFSHEDIEPFNRTELENLATETLKICRELLDSYRLGQIISNGLDVVIVGSPNVGKSSLLNKLVEHERAIVTEIAGTTRDIVEGRLQLGGLSVRLLDTAGIQKTKDVVEKLGIERSLLAASESHVVLLILDLSLPVDLKFLDDIEGLASKKILVVGNKLDLVVDQEQVGFAKAEVKKILSSLGVNFEYFSASMVDGVGVVDIRRALESISREGRAGFSAVVTQSRHFDLLFKIEKGIERALGLFGSGTSAEFVAFELQEAILAVHELLGKEFDDQVMDRVFKEFCLGK